jgi:hypothetical protein
MNDERELSGRCQCGQISYVVIGVPIVIGHCYCKNCQRLTGAGHSSAAMFPESRVQITGTLTEYSFHPTPETVDTRLFCSTCGSQVLGKNSAAPNMLSIALGTLDNPNALPPQGSIYVKQKANWDLVDENIRVFEGSAAGQVKLTP